MDDLIKVKSQKLTSETSSKQDYSFIRAYDVRGIYPDELDAEVAYKVAKAYLNVNPGKKYALAYDMRHSSKMIVAAITQALLEENVEVDSLGMCTTDCLYFYVGKHNYDGGIMVTASHNSAQFNGIKLVKKAAAPVLMDDLRQAMAKLEVDLHYLPLPEVKPTREIDPLSDFIQHVLSFANGQTINKLKIAVDTGNGIAGWAVTELFKHYPSLELVPLYFEPHPDFPHHEANPSTSANLTALRKRMFIEKADLGVAFDGDGDRVFFLGRSGNYIEGYYIQALLSEYFLQRNHGQAIVYDPRYTRAIEAVAHATGGRAVVSKAGHAYIKQKMRQEDAVFGGESTSSHFYYRDNFYADSGIITLQIILKIISESGKSLDELIKSYQERFFVSGEKNFYLADRNKFSELTQKLKEEFPRGAFSDFDGFVIDFSDWRFSLRLSNTEPFLRVNIEAQSQALLTEKQAMLFNTIAQFAQFTGEVSNIYSLQTINLNKQQKLEYLFSNLLFTWNSSKGNYLESLYGEDWARNHTPLDVVRQIDRPLLDKFYEDNKYNIEESFRLQQTYLTNDTWFDVASKHDTSLQHFNTNPIAYFSLEFGLVDWLQTYSGGLGILAGDTIKQASDTGLPLVGIGLFYAQGYFYQRFGDDGWQVEDYLEQDSDDYPIETVKDAGGNTIIVDVPLGEKIIKVRAWRLKVGRRSLLLLDTNFAENHDPVDRMITYHLYGGDEDTRIRQEVILAVGGYKILQASGISPSILHLNEGHSAFAVLAQAEDLMKTKGLDFNGAIAQSRQNIIFTNHTLKQAGNDVFPYALVEKYLAPYAPALGVEFREIFALGVDPLYAEGNFGMTILGLNNAAKINAVSKIHAKAAQEVWPDHQMEPITNGVHLTTWVSEAMHELFDEYISEGWNDTDTTHVNWKKILDVPNQRLWNAHQAAKQLLIQQLKYNCNVDVPETALIFSWFRRVTAYKQPEILLLDLDWLEKLVSVSDRPVVFVVGGKAHPQDEKGKLVLQELYRTTQQERFKGKFILVPDYNWRIARYMVSGSDVWVNSPIRLQEACGTSGMKAAANGTLIFSTIDGWVDEIKDKDIVWEITENLSAEAYFKQLETEIIPLFWQRNAEGLPEAWLERMKRTIQVVLSHYGTNRMLVEYLEKLYKPLLKQQKA